jgi:hypothetical protein
MWYEYIGENKCGWRLIKRSDHPRTEYNYINHKGEFLFEKWIPYAVSFSEETQAAKVMFEKFSFALDRIDVYGNVIDKEPSAF